MTDSRIQFMQDSAWKRNAKREVKPFLQLQSPIQADDLIIDLPEPDLLPEIQINFLEMVELRSTGRIYNVQELLSLKELSYLLWCTQGVKMIMGNKTVRNAPSAGGKNPLETFMYIRRVEGLQPGLYRFLPIEHKLVYIPTAEDFAEKFTESFSTKKVVADAAVVFLWTAVYQRTASTYGPRAYRYIHLDAGHVCENLYYAGQTMQIKTCPLGAFDDEELNALLGLDGAEQFAVYGAAVGK